MKLSESLVNFCIENLNDKNDWYNWKIDESKIPVNINLPHGNNYQKNIVTIQSASLQ